MYVFLVCLFLCLSVDYSNSKSSLLNGTTKGSDGENFPDDKVSFGFSFQ